MAVLLVYKITLFPTLHLESDILAALKLLKLTRIHQVLRILSLENLHLLR